MALFTPTDLQNHLQTPVVAQAAASAERVAWGWLKSATGLAERPDPVPDELFSWALELGGMVYENPTAHADETDGGLTTSYDRQRRADILTAAADWATRSGPGGGTSRAAPQGGGFPAPSCWPDPAEGAWRWARG